jgi:hypothetical protein
VTPAEAAAALRAVAALLTAAGAVRPTPALGRLADALEAAGGATLAAAARRLQALPEQRGDGVPLGTVEPLLPPLRTLLSAVGKAAGARDAAALAALIATHGGSDAEALARAASAKPAGTARTMARGAAKAPLREDLVAAHRQALEQALGDADRFSAAYAALEADAGMGRAELLALARQFAGAAARSRADALKRIWGRHAAVLTARAKAAATGGRSAA